MPAHVGQVEVEQDQQRRRCCVPDPSGRRTDSRAPSVPSAKWHDLVDDAGAADVLLDQPGMALVVLDHDDVDGSGCSVHAHAFRCCRAKVVRQRQPEGRALVQARTRASMSPPSRCAPARGHGRGRCPRRAGPARPERRNRSKMRSWSCGAMPRPLSLDLDDRRASPRCRAADARCGRAGPGCRYLTALSTRLPKICSSASRSRDDRRAAAVDRRSRRRPRRSDAGRCRRRSSTSASRSTGSGVEHAPALARQLQDGVDQPVHLLRSRRG